MVKKAKPRSQKRSRAPRRKKSVKKGAGQRPAARHGKSGRRPAAAKKPAQAKRPDLSPLGNLIETVRRLRAPDGCPWDRAQTHQSIRQYLIEEAYEVLDVLDNIPASEALKDSKLKSTFREELGDLLMQVLLHAQMASESGHFDFLDVARGLDEKLIRRHPHVFGEAAKANDEESAFQSWEKTKAKEKAANPEASILDGVPKGLPVLQRASRVLEKVTKVGFQWKDLEGPMGKVVEELREFQEEVSGYEALKRERMAAAQRAASEPATPEEDAELAAFRKRAEHELGDLLFSLCNVAYLLKLSPEDAFRTTIKRFETRFRHVEKRLKEQGRTPDQSTLEEMDRYWDEAKERE